MVDRALLLGLLKYTSSGALHHAPFSLEPCPLSPPLHDAMVAMTPAFNTLARNLSRESDFLADVLAPAVRVDDFTARLLDIAQSAGNTQPLFLGLIRSDYFVHHPHPGQPPAFRQVELNTISASYPGLSALVHRLHRDQSNAATGDPPSPSLVPNDPLPPIAEAFAAAVERYGYPGAMVLMVVQPNEANLFDQRLLEFALQARGLRVLRRSLQEIGEEASLREGHLTIGGGIAAITYFRAAYGPEDFPNEEAFRARRLIESSSTVSVPSLHTQLAGTKKVQQVLTDPEVLARFLDSREAAKVLPAFAGQYDLESDLATESGPLPAWQEAMARSGDYVLKPQREGGGHNFFDEEMVAKLTEIPPEERAAFVLMERIRPPARHAVLVAQGQATPMEAVSEIGRFGVCLADGAQEWINRDVGYLVRTKGQDTREGGVSAGFGFLDSLALSEE